MLKNDINVPLLATIGVISSMLLVVILLGVHTWYLWELQSEFGEKCAGATNAHVVEVKSAQLAHLQAFGKADPAKGTFRIPISVAMDQVAKNGGKLPK